MDSVSYADSYSLNSNPVYTFNYANNTASYSTSYAISSTAYTEEIPEKLIHLGYHENKENFEFPWEREGFSLKVSMRENGVDVTIKKEDKTSSFYHKYTSDMSEFRRLLLESEIEVSS